MRESSIEKHLRLAARDRYGMAFKFVSPNIRGVPDRIVLLPGGKIAFVELKALSKIPRKQQRHRIYQLKKLGFPVYVIDDVSQIEAMLDQLQKGENG